MPSRICKRMECVNLKTRAHANRPIGSCARLQLVFVHAENDTTMPWVETETLFKLTHNAALESISPFDGVPKNLKVVDLGEAGRQEVWQFGSKCIQKTIAKHGGKRNPPNACSM
jgi:abhydrolase domain-containing protein 12